MWGYTLGLKEYSDEELAIMAATYDATLVELDELFRQLMENLDARGELDNTLVVLVSDHGEHLGEHHLFDHQFSLYDELIRVPLILRGPGIESGVEDRPVMTQDLFATLQEVGGVAAPSPSTGANTSLLRPQESRPRLAEYLVTRQGVLDAFQPDFPEHGFQKYQRQLRAVTDGDLKYIWSSAGDHELFDLATDRTESSNLIRENPEQAARGAITLEGEVARLRPYQGTGEAPEIPEDVGELLRDLGYFDGDNDAKEDP